MIEREDGRYNTMRVTFEINDSKMDGFSFEAKNSLKKACKEYAAGIIDEARKIEQIDRMGSSQVEVIASHIDEARKIYRRAPSRSKAYIVIDVLVEVLLLIIGIMFDKEKLWNSDWYLIVFIGLIIILVVLLIMKYSKGA